MLLAPTSVPRARVLRATGAAALAVMAVAGLGGLMTDLGSWYAGLRQPAWKPPDSWFGAAWTTIYTLGAVAGVRVWLAAPSAVQRRQWLAAVGVNALLNILWSALFFRLRRPDAALLEVLLFWLSIVALIVIAKRIDALAAWLLAPYLLWVAFAAAINFAVVRLNAPF